MPPRPTAPFSRCVLRELDGMEKKVFGGTEKCRHLLKAILSLLQLGIAI